MKQVPHSRPMLGSVERKALWRVLASGHLAQGLEVEAFEKAMASTMDRKHAAAVSSGTAALQLALRALGVGPGDRVAIPSYVCSALLHAVSSVGARALLVDADPETFNMDPDDLRKRLRARTKAVVVAHMFGLPAALDDILDHGIPVIEDCAISLGARYRGKPVGAWGVLSVVSFYATKMITTGEGGMVLGDRSSLLDRVRDLRSYDGRFRHRRRFNYKMTDLQAALGRAQLERLENFVRRRRRLAGRYRRALAGGPWHLPLASREHVYYRFVMRLDASPAPLLAILSDSGVQARRPVFKPLHRYLGLEGFPGSERAYRRAVSIPLYPDMSEREVSHVIKSTQRAGRALLE